ncbi:hypothetical protein DER44DRAFT_768545 [Fusarium oxysporum]|nr:hypothetical protein DER44DRAFT_768545 [Fusarium oxysporum]
MADPDTEVAARVLCSLFKDRGNKETGQSSLPTPSLSPALPTPPLSDDQVHVTVSPSPSQTKILQCLEPAIPPRQCHLPVRLVLDHPSLTPGAKSTHSQLLLSNREGNSQPNRPVLHVRGLFCSNKLPALPDPDPNPDRQLSYHADGTWEEGAAALSLLLVNLPDLRNYEGEMLEMRDSLEGNMFELCRLMEHRDGGLPRELVEKKMMYYLEFIFRLAGEGDEQRTILEQERAKMELALSWVSGLIRHWDEHVSTVLFADAMEQNPHHHQRHQGAN